MKSFSQFVLVLMCFFIWGGTSLWADTYFVDGAGQAGVDDDRAAAVDLVQSAVAEIGHQVTDDATKAEYTLRPKLLKLGSSYIFKLEKTRAGKSVFASQMKVQRVEELDRVARRLTQAVIANQSPENTRVKEIATEDTSEGGVNSRVKGYHFALGPAFLSNAGASGLGYSLAFGKAWDVDVAVIKLRGEVFGKNSALGLDFGVSGNYFLLKNNYAPFVGAEFGVGAIRQNTGALFSDDFHIGFWMGPTAGVQLFRHAEIQVELAVKWSILLSSTTLGHPHYFAFRVGLYF